MRGVTLPDKKISEWVREQTVVSAIIIDAKKKKWRWAGHVIGRLDDRSPVRTTERISREGNQPWTIE